MSRPPILRMSALLVALLAALAPDRAFAQAAPAQPPAAPAPPKQDEDARPYDERLGRLAELLGAIHYLRELCGANEGQQWRDRMRELIEAEGSSALRKARLSRNFNGGYRMLNRSYQTCTPSAQATAQKFMAEGAQIAETLVKSVP